MEELIKPIKISLDFYKRNIVQVNAKQLDTQSRYIDITFTKNGQKIALNDATVSAIIRYKKTDGYYAFNGAEQITDSGTALFELTQQMLAVSGQSIADVMLINATGLKVENISDIKDFYDLGCSVISTMSFFINTEATAIEYGVIESSYEYNQLVTALSANAAIEQHMKELEETIKIAEADRVAKETERIANEVERVEKESERIKNEEERNVNEETRKSNEDSRQEEFSTQMTETKNATSDCIEVTTEAIDKIDKMTEIEERINQSIGTVINDNLVSPSTTYSSEKLENMFSDFVQYGSQEPTNQTIGGIWLIEE